MARETQLDHKAVAVQFRIGPCGKRMKPLGRVALVTGVLFLFVVLPWGLTSVTLAGEGTLSETRTEALQANDKSSDKKLLFLTLPEALKLAIEGNKEIQISAFSPAIAEDELNAVLAVYDPSLFEENSIFRTNRPIQSILDNGTTGNGNLLEHKWNLRAGIKKPLPTGGTVSLFTEVDHLNSSSELILPNPQNTARLTVQLRQALLREFGDKSNRAAIDIADRKRVMSNAEYRKTLARVLMEVGASFWNLAYYQKQLDIRREGLKAAESVYQNEIIRNETGISTLLDVDRAFSEVQDRKRDLIISNTQLMLSMDQFKLILGMAPNSPYFSIDIQPAEKILLPSQETNREDLIKEAMRDRPELIISNKKINIATIKKELAKHQKLPRLDVMASYSRNGLATQVDNAFDDTYGNNDASWEVGLGFEWPIGDQKAAALYNKALRESRQARIEQDKTIAQITYEVTSTLTEIEQAGLEIEATKNARDANERVLEREKARFELGKISSRDLLKAQNNLHDAERNYLKAIINYNVSLLKLKWAKGTIAEDFEIKQPNDATS